MVSTLAEASFYADGGYDDILYAYPVTADKVKRCAELSEKLSLFHVLVDNSLALQELKAWPLKQGKVWHVWLKLDCDNGRGKRYSVYVTFGHVLCKYMSCDIDAVSGSKFSFGSHKIASIADDLQWRWSV